MTANRKNTASTFKIEQIRISQLEMHLRGCEIMMVPITVQNAEETVEMEMRFSLNADNGITLRSMYKTFEEGSAEIDSIIQSFKEDNRFAAERERITETMDNYTLKKPILNLEVISHKFTIDSITRDDEKVETDLWIDFKFAEENGNEHTGTLHFCSADNYHASGLFGLDSLYLGFEEDLARMLKEKMKLVFLLAQGE